MVTRFWRRTAFETLELIVTTALPAGALHQESFHVQHREEPAAGVLPAFREGRAASSYTSKESGSYRERSIDSVRTARSVVCAPLPDHRALPHRTAPRHVPARDCQRRSSSPLRQWPSSAN